MKYLRFIKLKKNEKKDKYTEQLNLHLPMMNIDLMMLCPCAKSAHLIDEDRDA
jgi:hypothetical protein